VATLEAAAKLLVVVDLIVHDDRELFVIVSLL
jgi:hypothetical protein